LSASSKRQREHSLPSYRLFKLRVSDGRREPGEWLDANDDDEALRLAGELARESKLEVWLRDRLVGIAVRQG
jgi:hypothetical protein